MALRLPRWTDTEITASFQRSAARIAHPLLRLAFLSVINVAVASDLEVFQTEIQPVLDEYCYDCHGNGNKKGGIQLDGFEGEAALHDHNLWQRALKNVTGIMPPADEPGQPAEEGNIITEWIKHGPFSLDPLKSDPGRVTVGRLNRVDYRNTIHELLGVDFDTQKEFPQLHRSVVTDHPSLSSRPQKNKTNQNN